MAKTPIDEVVKTVAVVRLLQQTVDGHDRELALLQARLADVERRVASLEKP